MCYVVNVIKYYIMACYLLVILAFFDIGCAGCSTDHYLAGLALQPMQPYAVAWHNVSKVVRRPDIRYDRWLLPIGLLLSLCHITAPHITLSVKQSEC